MKQLSIHGLEFSIFDEGDGPPLLFVHGFPLDHTMWRGQLAEFATAYRVIAPDLRGFGASGIGEAAVTMEQFADDLAAILDTLGVREPVALVGLSMGGYVAWQFVRKYRCRLRALVLCDTKAAADSPEAAESRLKVAETVLADGTEALARAMVPKLFAKRTIENRSPVVEAVRKVILQCNRQGVAAAQRGMAARPDVTDMLATIDVPTLVIVGEDDVISPPEEMRRIAQAIPGSRLVAIPKAGHLAPLENPAAFNAALGEFLAAVEGRRAPYYTSRGRE
ncbi:MAG TPA: alpha/beta fold hydrolase [Pirellulales bacterium]|nr:alpha/beta fold hydrolase [Pirellulales bacterium]